MKSIKLLTFLASLIFLLTILFFNKVPTMSTEPTLKIEIMPNKEIDNDLQINIRTINNRNDKYYLCKCECGTIKLINRVRLASNRSKCCIKCKNKKYNEYIFNKNHIVGITKCGYEFIVDTIDFELIKDYCWHKHQDGYLRTCIGQNENGGNVYILQHVLILGKLDELEIDHINGNPNDNRRENIRHVTHSENMKNLKNIYKNNKSGIIGVYYSNTENKWKAHLSYNKKMLNLGTFKTKDEAIISRLNKEFELYGKESPQFNLFKQYKRLNVILDSNLK